jgi:hypothetical protein
VNARHPAHARLGTRRKPRILILDCFSDNHRGAKGNPMFVPQPMTGAVLAGQLHRDKVEIRLHCEFTQGPFADFAALRWAELLVLTGLNPAFDRMKQVTAYARTLNPGIRVAMGGPLARVLPRLSRLYFDYVCTEDVEQIVDVVHDVFGASYQAEAALPRYDLTRWMGLVGFAESSKNCNFRCNFCSMTAEDRPFTGFDVDYLRRQVEAQGYRACVMFLDQNFYGGPRSHFRARIAALKQLREQGKMGGWAALVTSDFFNDPENLRLAKESGCIGFFCGVESFSKAQIAAFRKKQNLILPQEEVIQRSLDAGLVFHYGMVLDPGERRVRDLQEEIDFIVDNPRLALPSFISLVIPLLGTPLFRQRLAEGAFLPNLKLRSMDGRSLLCHPLDSLDAATAFVARLDSGLISKRKLAAHAWHFYRHYRGRLKGWSMASILSTYWAMAYPGLGTNGRERAAQGKDTKRSHLGSTEPLGSHYRPVIPVPECYRAHFEPLFITDPNGELHEAVCDDLESVHVPKASMEAWPKIQSTCA